MRRGSLGWTWTRSVRGWLTIPTSFATIPASCCGATSSTTVRASVAEATFGCAPASSDEAFAEVSVEIGDEDACLELFAQLGFPVVRYQENYREQWRWESIVFDLDEWPGLPPFVEIEGASADDVAGGARYLGLSMEAAEYDNVADTYRRYAGRDILSEPRLVF